MEAMITGVVEVQVRKGLTEETVTKLHEFGYDDLPEDMAWNDVAKMARAEVERYYENLIDDRPYGKFWEIVGIHST